MIEHKIAAELPGITGRKDTEVNKLLASCKAIEEVGQTLTIYTDGSAAAATRVDPQVRQAIRVKGAAFTSSCEEGEDTSDVGSDRMGCR